MKNFKTVLALAMLLVFVMAAVSYAQLANTDWPKNKRDASNSGRSPATAIAKPVIKWHTSLTTGSYTAGGASPSGPVVDSDGSVYVVDTGGGAITKINADGSFGWTSVAQLGGGYWGSPAIWSNGTTKQLVFGLGWGNLGLHSVNPTDGSTNWTVVPQYTGGGSPSPAFGDGAPAIGSDGTIYVTGGDGWDRGQLYAIDPATQTVKWTFPDPFEDANNIGYNYGAPVVTTVAGKTVVIVMGKPLDQNASSIFAIQDNGTSATKLWSAPCGYHWNNPVLSNDGQTVYAVGFKDWGAINLFAFNVADGTLKWSIDSTTNSFSTPVVGANGTIYIGGQNGRFVAITDNGTSATIKWGLNFPSDTGECTTPAVTSSNPPVVYVGTYGFGHGKMYAIRDEGSTYKIIWHVGGCGFAVSGDPATPAIAANGTLYTQWGTELVAFDTGFVGAWDGKIKGYVKTGIGLPIAGAIVAAGPNPRPLPDNPDSTYAITDANGYFELTGLHAGTYYVAAWAAGRTASDDVTVTLTSDSDVKTVPNIVLSLVGVNLAIGKDAYTDQYHSDPNYAPSKAVDGDQNTRYVSSDGTTYPTYLFVDLGADKSVNQVNIYWENALANSYKVQCLPSTSDPSWEENWETEGITVYETTCATGGYRIDSNHMVDVIKFAPTSGQYWRVQSLGGGGVVSLWEFEVRSATEAPGLVAGVIRDKNGNPVFNAVYALNGTVKGITDVDGKYTLADFPTGTPATISADALKFAKRNFTLTVNPGVELAQDIVLASAPFEPGFYNSDFEIADPLSNVGASGWEVHAYTGGSYARSTTENKTPGGTAAEYMHVNTPDWWCAIRNTADKYPAVIGDGSVAYNIYYWVKNNAGPGAGGGFMRADFYDATKTSILRTDANVVIDDNPTWAPRLVDYQAVPPTGASWMRFRIYHSDTRCESFVDAIVLDAVYLSSTTNSLADLKSLSDGCAVSLTGKITTCAQGVGGLPSDVFYIEEPTRFAGIRVKSSTPVTPNKLVSVAGVMATTEYGERYIDATTVTLGASATCKPLGATTGTILGDLMDGLLVKVAGTVKSVGSNYFTVSDGYVKDGSEVELKVFTGGAPGVTVGSFVTVTGVASYDGSRVILKVP